MSTEPKKSDDGKPAEGKKSSKGLMIGLIAGGAVLLLCCCTGVGSTALWYYLTPGGNQKAIVGVWSEQAVTFDFRADGKLKRNKFDLVYKFVDSSTIEIGPDKAGNITLNGQPYPTIRYRVEIRDRILTLNEVSPPEPGQPPEKYSLKRR